MRAGESICLAGADDGAATVWGRYFVIGVVRITWGRRAKECRPGLMRFGFRHAGAEQTAALGTGGQMRATRRGHAAQDNKNDSRAAASDEFPGVAAELDGGTTEMGGQRGDVAQLMARKQALERDTQLRMTRTTRGLQRATSSSELLRC